MRVLIVDEDRRAREQTARLLSEVGYASQPMSCPHRALGALGDEDFDVVLTEWRLPLMQAPKFISAVRERHSGVDLVVATADPPVEWAVEAMQLGASDVFAKPIPFERLAHRMAALKQSRAQRRTLGRLLTPAPTSGECLGLLGESGAMSRLRGRIRLFAPHDAPVLITGETGTGKELVARALHLLSPRADGPLVAVGCGSVPPQLAESELFGHEKGSFTSAQAQHLGRFEQAHRGTLLLDDVDDLPLEIQVKLLRVLQEGRIQRVGGHGEVPVDVRLVATSKVDLGELVRQGRFRDDLFYRLRGLELRLPPLRDREGDVLQLACHFTRMFSRRQKTLGTRAAQLLASLAWPGNVRELRRTLETAVILAPSAVIEPADLPEHVFDGDERMSPLFSLHLHGRDAVDMPAAVCHFEDALLDWAIAKATGNQKQAAQLLGLPRSTFQSKLGRRPIR
jgi:DNA-binding NtrC family response regulator